MKRNKQEFEKHKKDALALAKSRLEYWNAFYGFTYKRVTVKDTKTRWGSCSSKGNLNFNYKIALLPPRLADYIIVHELCHLGEFNHSYKFWALVARTFPDYKQLRLDLRQRSVVQYLQLSTIKAIEMKLKKVLGVLILVIAFAPGVSSAKTTAITQGISSLKNAKSYTYDGIMTISATRGKTPTATTRVDIMGKADLSDEANSKQQAFVTVTDTNPNKIDGDATVTLEGRYVNNALFLQLVSMNIENEEVKNTYAAFKNIWIKLTPEATTTKQLLNQYDAKSSTALDATTTAKMTELFMNSDILVLGKKVGTKTVGGVVSTGYAFTINKTNLLNYDKKVTLLTTGKNMTTAQIARAKKDLDKLKYSNATIWFGNTDKLIHRVTLTLLGTTAATKYTPAVKSSIAMDLSISNYGVPQVVEQPASYKTIEELMKAYYAMYLNKYNASSTYPVPQLPQ